MRRACRDAISALGLGLGATLLVATVIAWRVALAQRYWESGYLRLIADCVWDRFDRIVPGVAVAALLAAGAVSVLQRRATRGTGRALVRVGLTLLVLVGVL